MGGRIINTDKINNNPSLRWDVLLEHVAEDKKDLVKIYMGMELRNEELVLTGLKNILFTQGKEAIYLLNEGGMIFYLKENEKSESYESNLFAALVFNDFIQVAQILLECGVNVNYSGVSNKHNPNGRYVGASALSLACQFGSVDMVQLLLKNNADLLHLTKAGDGVLMNIKSAEICRLILQAAREQKKLEFLLMISANGRRNIFNNACVNGKIEVLHELLNIEHYTEYCDARSFLHHARMAAWLFPELADEFENICEMLRPLQEEQIPVVKFSCTPSDIISTQDLKVVAEAYFTLFTENLDSIDHAAKGKNQAIKIAIAQIYVLFSSVKNVLPYLVFLNEDFSAYYRKVNKGELPHLDPSSYDFKIINGLNYPIPNDHYAGFKKGRSLPAFLILLLNKYGLAKDAYKWIGLVHEGIAQKMFAEGDFITEDVNGLTLFHGKLSHMLQYAIIVYAMEHEKINVDYEIEGKIEQITIKDILNEFGVNLALREIVVDVRYPECISFSDPFRLISIMMEKGPEFEFKFLAHYLIDSFCKGIRKRLDTCKQMYNLPDMDMKKFSEQAKDFMLEAFSDTPQSMNYVKQLELNKNPAKNRSSFFYAENDNYAVVQKTYPHHQFSPKKFSL